MEKELAPVPLLLSLFPELTNMTTTATEPPDLGTLALVLGGLGGVILIVIVVVFIRRKAPA
ncbi:MAG: hypothetical protein EAX95_14885 [Candidatus Thorarchaeota archaeon]|nr:hypothetical protein [Candidatus Thorarchaeota archaeon]